MTDWGMSGRRDTYRFTAVDPFSLIEQGDVDAIPAECSITYGAYTDNIEQATIVMTEEAYQQALGNLIRIHHTVELPDGTSESEVLGTFFIDTAEKDESYIQKRRCSCYSTMWRLSQDFLAADYVVKSRSLCKNGLSKLITADGASLVMGAEVTNSTRAHTQDVRFKAGSNRLECANTYAGWCGWTIGVDDHGRQTLTAYVPPRSRQRVHDFTDGADCTYLPQIRETYTGEVCNRVIALWSREKDNGDGYGTSARAVVDLPASSPWSYESCGRRIPYVLRINEPKTNLQLAQLALAYLNEHDAAIRYIEIEHVGIPHLRAGDVVTYTNEQMGDFNLVCEVTQMDISIAPLMLTRTKLKVMP